MSEISYLIDGREVAVLEKVSAGVLVCGIYDDEDSVIRDDDHPFIVDRVYDHAPTAKYDKDIEFLQGRVNNLLSEEKACHERIRAMQRTEQEAKMEFAKFPKLKRLLDFIAGKLTHYVVVDYRGIDIIEFSDSVANDSDNQYERKERKKMRMLSLFGAASKDLEWRLNDYSDGSGMGEECYPCCSREEAMVILREKISEKISKGPREDVLKNADKYGIEVPPEYRHSVVENARKNLLNQIAVKEAEINKSRAELSKLPCHT